MRKEKLIANGWQKHGDGVRLQVVHKQGLARWILHDKDLNINVDEKKYTDMIYVMLKRELVNQFG